MESIELKGYNMVAVFGVCLRTSYIGAWIDKWTPLLLRVEFESAIRKNVEIPSQTKSDPAGLVLDLTRDSDPW